ncbi:MAG: SP_1767 family glycosyltransferase [Bacilli bacterium]
MCEKNNLNILSVEETIKYIIKNNSSFSRFGDGEINLINGIGNGFQSSNLELGMRLKEILNSDLPNHFIGVPSYFNGFDKFTWDAKLFFCEHLFLQGDKWVNICSKKGFFGDALSTRFYIDYRHKNRCKGIIALWKELWRNRDIVVIEGDKTRLGINNDLFQGAKSLKRIICPNENAFQKYELILEEALKQSKTDLIIIALGQTATVLAYDLAQYGFQAIDIGHIDIEYEWYLRKAKKKCPVPYKYVNEIHERNVEAIDSENIYYSQIVSSIV